LRLSYANVAATVALVFAMAGGAVAATHYIITSTSQIKPSVRAALRGARGPRGPAGSPASYPSTLPSGRTETGVFAIRTTSPGPGTDAPDDPISFGLPLASSPTRGGPSDCTGSVGNPTAAPGKFCLYPNQNVNVGVVFVLDPGTGVEGTSRQGVILVARAAAAGDKIYRGTWAVTAP
jgi:hypothetical protein